jgi:spermidine/putrescine transport system permease protein
MPRSRAGPRAPWLAAITFGYLVWSLGPLILAIVYSFNAGSSITHWEGFSLRWWVGDPATQESILYDPSTRSALEHSLWLAILTTVIAVPIGTAFAMGCWGWRSRLSRLGLWTMLVALAIPPVALGAAMWLLFAYPLRGFPLGDFGWFGTRAQVAGLVTVGLPLATLVIWARLLFLNHEQEEMAADLGAPPGGFVWRVLLPQLAPAIGGAAAVVFAGALGEFVIVQALVGTNETRALGPALLGARQGPEPRFSAIGTVLAVTGGAAYAVLALTFRAAARGSRRLNEPI